MRNDAVIFLSLAELLAFDIVNDSLASSILLVDLVTNTKLCLTVNTSDFAVGAILEQIVNSHARPLAFFSCHLKVAETCYNTFEKILLATHLTATYFYHFLVE